MTDSFVLYAEFRADTELRKAVAQVSREPVILDVFSPIPIPDLEPQLGIRRSTLPAWVLCGGLLGAAAAYATQLWCAAIAYPLDVGGRPLHSAPAFIPITFELGVLAASLTAFVAVLVKGRLVRLYDPVFELEGFERATSDRFWLSARGAKTDVERIGAGMVDVGALRVVVRRCAL